MTSSEWELPLDEETKKLGKFSRVKVKGSEMHIYNGKARKPMCTFPYNGNELYDTIEVKCRAALVEIGYEEDLITRLCTRLINAIEEYVKSQAQEQYESGDEGSIWDNKLKPLRLMKYTKGIPYGIPAAESIILGGTKPMWLQIVDGKAKLSKEISLPDGRSLQPWDIGTSLSLEYEFSSEEEINSYIKRAKNETLDTLFNRSKSFWMKYIDADNYHHSICAADTISTYFVDKSSSTHYLLFVGDNATGKSNNLNLFEHLVYRPLSSVSLTAAGIYRTNGNFEEGQVTILEDQIDNIENQPDKMGIYETGYKTGAKVCRSDDTLSGRKSHVYLTYGFKAFTSEKQPDNIKCKAFNERVFVINCSPGYPEYDISEVIAHEGDEDLKAQFDQLADFRKLLLIYRMLHYNDPIPNIKLNIKNRDKQLCKPLLRLFQGTKAVGEISESLWQLLREKKNRKANTLEARIYKIVNDLGKLEKSKSSLNEDDLIATSADIWGRVKLEISGVENKQSFETEEYDTITQRQIASICESRFLGVHDKDPKTGRMLFIFSRKKLEKIGANYSVEGIKIIDIIKPKSGASGASGASTSNTKHFETSKATENVNNHPVGVENTQDSTKNLVNITTQTSQKDSQSPDKAPEAPEAPKMSHLSKEAQNEEIPSHLQEPSQTSSQTTTLPSFGINNPLEKDITSDTGTDQQTAEVSSDSKELITDKENLTSQPSQVLPTHRIKPKTDELSTFRHLKNGRYLVRWKMMKDNQVNSYTSQYHERNSMKH
jgi:hypothetical protein